MLKEDVCAPASLKKQYIAMISLTVMFNEKFVILLMSQGREEA